MAEDRRGSEKPRINEPFPPPSVTSHDTASRAVTGHVAVAPSAPARPVDDKFKEGIRLFRIKRWDKALRELSRFLSESLSDGEQTELAYYLGLCYAKLDRYDEALPFLEQVCAGHNVLRVYQCRMTLAYRYLVTGRHRQAETELKRLHGTGFESAPLCNTLAYAAYAQKNYQDAVDWYEKALEIDENNTTAMNCLGFILADTGMDVLRGLRLCRRAVERKPRIAAYLDSLGWPCYKGGKVPEARLWLRRALDMAAANAEITEHYRVVCEAVV